ncbi:MAG: transcriptional repressor LexA [Candidatus Eisenbacteria bacterium]|nr:transcriptional repressor LexA [Candidatus Eisenbacteria bacterium]
MKQEKFVDCCSNVHYDIRKMKKIKIDELTPLQKRILDHTTWSIREKGMPPTIRELCEKFGISSTNGIRYHLGKLQKSGFLKRVKSKSRGIELVEKDDEKQPKPVRIPVLGRVQAGAPVLAEENIEEYLSLDEGIVRHSKCFALRVKGDSMKGVGMFDGDIIVVKQQSTANSGEIVVALLDNEATVKRFFQKGNRVILKPENPAHNPISVGKSSPTFRILGKVTGVIRKL